MESNNKTESVLKNTKDANMHVRGTMLGQAQHKYAKALQVTAPAHPR